MRTEVATIVDRLLQSRSLPWLRIVDAADLDQPAEPAEAPAEVVEPYRWLLERIGDGVRLTQAGYLPPALVTEAMVTLGWAQDWYGKHNREDVTRPILLLRESAQRFGLLRKSRGQLLVTKAGRALIENPAELWWHLADRLPDARQEPERDAGVLYLLTVAAGQAEDDALLAQGMTILGWASGETGRQLSPTSAFVAARDTWAVFDRLGLLPKHGRWQHRPPTPQARTLARAALLGRDDAAPATRPADPRPATTNTEPAVQLLVRLQEIEPAIWRRLVVPQSLTLGELHGVIQTAMGWQNHHLHLFEIAGISYGDVEDMDGPLGDEKTVTVGEAAAAATEFSYDYDFGDGWSHDIRVEGVGSSAARVIDGARACPPEDCGGPWGYQRLLEVLADPTHEEHADLLEWLGKPFDPEAFDLAETNANLQLYDRHIRRNGR